MSAINWFFYFVILSAALALHEIGHWAELHRCGIRLSRITLGLGPSVRLWGRLHLALFPFGASVSPDPAAWAQASAHTRFKVALAGPVASFICAGVLAAVGLLYPNATQGMMAFASLHFAIGAFNILPVPPLDGWHILTELLATHKKPLSPQATGVALRLGNGMIYGLGFWYVGGLATGLW